MTLDPQSRHIGGMHYDHMPYPGGPSPSFTNPWAGTTSAPSTAHLFPTSLGPSHSTYEALPKQQAARTSNVSMAQNSPQNTTSVAPSSSYTHGAYAQPELLGIAQPDLLHAPRAMYEQAYSNSTSPPYAPTSAPYLGTFGQLSQPAIDGQRRLSHTLVLVGVIHWVRANDVIVARRRVLLTPMLSTHLMLGEIWSLSVRISQHREMYLGEKGSHRLNHMAFLHRTLLTLRFPMAALAIRPTMVPSHPRYLATVRSLTWIVRPARCPDQEASLMPMACRRLNP